MSKQESEGLIGSLHNLEVRLLRAFEGGVEYGAEELAKGSGMEESRVRRAAEWLITKGALALAEESTEQFVTLSEAGARYVAEGTPERRVLNRVSEGKGVPVGELKALPGLDASEVGPAIGVLRKNKIIEVGPDGNAVPGSGKPDIVEQLESLLARLAEAARLPVAGLSPEEAAIARAGTRKRGKSRGPLEMAEETRRTYRLTPVGTDLRRLVIDRGMTGDEVSRLTPDLLRSGEWRAAKFRRYDMSIRPPRGIVARRHPYRQFLDFVKDRLVAMGFVEMAGPLVETEFWNMDALYMPQFHSARDIHDVYVVKEPRQARELPEPFASKVAQAHENGGGTGSSGWGYKLSLEKTRRLVLRSQGTALSARALARGATAPGKYYAMARCFRYDTVDATHAADFFQVEGIVLGEDITLRHLLGLLKLFATEIAGAPEVKFTPAYFPFTEPSVEVHMRHPKLGWMELGGAGMFRPEVTNPLGTDVPVIAWGLGLDRMAMVALKIDDIRDLFSPDLEFVRSRAVAGLGG